MSTWFLLFYGEIKIFFLIPFRDGNQVLFPDRMGITLIIPLPDGNHALIHISQGNMTVYFKMGLFVKNLVWIESIKFNQGI